MVEISHSPPRILLVYNHVKGHKDEETALEDLFWEAQMNCHMTPKPPAN